MIFGDRNDKHKLQETQREREASWTHFDGVMLNGGIDRVIGLRRSP